VKEDGSLEVESLSEDQLHWTIRYSLFELSSLFFLVFASPQGGSEALKTFAEKLKLLQLGFEKAKTIALASLKTEKFDYQALPALSSFAQVQSSTLPFSSISRCELIIINNRCSGGIAW